MTNIQSKYDTYIYICTRGLQMKAERTEVLLIALA